MEIERIEKKKVDALANEVSRNWWVKNKMNVFEELQEEEDVEITPLVKSLCGIIDLPQDFDYRIEYGDYLLKKYK